MSASTAFEHLNELHEKYARRDLRGMWQRDGSSPPKPAPRLWPWQDVAPLLDESLRKVRLPEDTDQRVIGLAAPEFSNRAVYVSYQLLNPGEQVPSHRHTPAQMRFIIQGTGAYTTSDGERMFMEPGDLLVQPNWSWHGTANVGEGPVYWLDIQDRNLVNYLGAFRRELWPDGEVQPTAHPENYHARIAGALRPVKPGGAPQTLPPTHYKWRDTLRAIDEIAEVAETAAVNPYDGLVFEYTNASTSGSTLPTLSAQIQVLQPSEKTREHRHTGTTMYFVVMGQGATAVDGTTIEWRERDCFMLPPLAWHSHQNGSKSLRAMLFTVSDRPTLEALGLYHEEGR
jgi:gentisate 1,2-dioxygenase